MDHPPIHPPAQGPGVDAVEQPPAPHIDVDAAPVVALAPVDRADRRPDFFTAPPTADNVLSHPAVVKAFAFFRHQKTARQGIQLGGKANIVMSQQTAVARMSVPDRLKVARGVLNTIVVDDDEFPDLTSCHGDLVYVLLGLWIEAKAADNETAGDRKTRVAAELMELVDDNLAMVRLSVEHALADDDLAATRLRSEHSREDAARAQEPATALHEHQLLLAHERERGPTAALVRRRAEETAAAQRDAAAQHAEQEDQRMVLERRRDFDARQDMLRHEREREQRLEREHERERELAHYAQQQLDLQQRERDQKRRDNTAEPPAGTWQDFQLQAARSAQAFEARIRDMEARAEDERRFYEGRMASYEQHLGERRHEPRDDDRRTMTDADFRAALSAFKAANPGDQRYHPQAMNVEEMSMFFQGIEGSGEITESDNEQSCQKSLSRRDRKVTRLIAAKRRFMYAAAAESMAPAALTAAWDAELLSLKVDSAAGKMKFDDLHRLEEAKLAIERAHKALILGKDLQRAASRRHLWKNYQGAVETWWGIRALGASTEDRVGGRKLFDLAIADMALKERTKLNTIVDYDKTFISLGPEFTKLGRGRGGDRRSEERQSGYRQSRDSSRNRGAGGGRGNQNRGGGRANQNAPAANAGTGGSRNNSPHTDQSRQPTPKFVDGRWTL